MALSTVSRGLQKVTEKLSHHTEGRIISEYLERAGMPNARSIHTFTTGKERDTLLELASHCPESGKILEIGSYVGASTCYLAAGAFGRDITIFCCDTWNNETMPGGIMDTFVDFSKNTAPVSAMLRTLRKKSVELKAEDIELPINLAFLDGDHSYKCARSDFDTVKNWIAEDGVIAFHDTASFEGVSRLLGEVLATGEWRLAGHVNNLSWIQRAKWEWHA